MARKVDPTHCMKFLVIGKSHSEAETNIAQKLRKGDGLTTTAKLPTTYGARVGELDKGQMKTVKRSMKTVKRSMNEPHCEGRRHKLH